MTSWFRLGSMAGLVVAPVAAGILIGGEPSQAAPDEQASPEPIEK